MKIKSCVELKKHADASSPCLKVSDFVYVSAQLPCDPESGEIVSNDIVSQTKQCMENAAALLKKADLDMHYVVKTTVYLLHEEDYEQMDQIYRSFFEEPYPARSVCYVNHLKKNARVQIECTAIDYRCLEVLCCEEECCDEDCCEL